MEVEGYEICNVIDQDINKIHLNPNIQSDTIVNYYIRTCVYDSFLAGTDKVDSTTLKQKYLKQLKLDIPRSHVFIDNELITTYNDQLEPWLIPYCTQAVMSMPLLLLNSKDTIITERRIPQRMTVRVFINRFIIINKTLDICLNNATIPITFFIKVDKEDSYVVIKAIFEEKTPIRKDLMLYTIPK